MYIFFTHEGFAEHAYELVRTPPATVLLNLLPGPEPFGTRKKPRFKVLSKYSRVEPECVSPWLQDIADTRVDSRCSFSIRHRNAVWRERWRRRIDSRSHSAFLGALSLTNKTAFLLSMISRLRPRPRRWSGATRRVPLSDFRPHFLRFGAHRVTCPLQVMHRRLHFCWK